MEEQLEKFQQMELKLDELDRNQEKSLLLNVERFQQLEQRLDVIEKDSHSQNFKQSTETTETKDPEAGEAFRDKEIAKKLSNQKVII